MSADAFHKHINDKFKGRRVMTSYVRTHKVDITHTYTRLCVSVCRSQGLHTTAADLSTASTAYTPHHSETAHTRPSLSVYVCVCVQIDFDETPETKFTDSSGNETSIAEYLLKMYGVECQPRQPLGQSVCLCGREEEREGKREEGSTTHHSKSVSVSVCL